MKLIIPTILPNGGKSLLTEKLKSLKIITLTNGFPMGNNNVVLVFVFTVTDFANGNFAFLALEV